MSPLWCMLISKYNKSIKQRYMIITSKKKNRKYLLLFCKKRNGIVKITFREMFFFRRDRNHCSFCQHLLHFLIVCPDAWELAPSPPPSWLAFSETKLSFLQFCSSIPPRHQYGKFRVQVRLLPVCAWLIPLCPQYQRQSSFILAFF